MPAAAQNSVIDIPLPAGVQRALLAGPADPPATLIMFAGGSGIVDIADDGAIRSLAANFLIRTQALWLAQGFAVMILGSPNRASLLGQRHTPGYAAAIHRAVELAGTRARAPIWLVGTSQGSTAAANGAAQVGGVAGVVLTSSVTRAGQAGETVFDSDPGRIAVPGLVVANRGDTCPTTPPEDAPVLAGHLSRSPRVETMLFSSSRTQSAPCEAMSPHGFLGIEGEVVQRIAAWIKAVPGR